MYVGSRPSSLVSMINSFLLNLIMKSYLDFFSCSSICTLVLHGVQKSFYGYFSTDKKLYIPAT